MKISKLLFVTLLIIISLVNVGCSAVAEKPAQPVEPAAPVSPQSAAPLPTTYVFINPISPADVTNLAVSEAGKISGVKAASAFVADTIVYVGLDLQDNSDIHKSLIIENNVSNQINSIKSGYIVRVTSDMDTVKLIKTVAQGIAQGLPITNFNNEVHNVVMKLTPKRSRLLNLHLYPDLFNDRQRGSVIIFR